jgi:hypothetical protein
VSSLPLVIAHGVAVGINNAMGGDAEAQVISLEKVLNTMPYRSRSEDAEG